MSKVTREELIYMIENDKDYSNVDTSNITNMSGMFCNKEVKYDISKWDVSNVTNMSNMFDSCTNFNQDISNWDVSKVTDMFGMFDSCTSFNQDISKWDVSNVTDRFSMFNEVPAYEVYSNCGENNRGIYKYPNKDIWFCGCRVSTAKELIDAIIKKYGSLEAYGITDGFKTYSFYLLDVSVGGGKALSNDTLVKVESGWKKIGDITINDKVMSVDESYVTGVYPQGLKEWYTSRKRTILNQIIFKFKKYITI